MLRLFSTIQKELLILVRDRGGLAVMFLMPMAMIIIMALIQDVPFRDYQEFKIPLLLANKDKGSLGETIEHGLKQSKIFEITKVKYPDRVLNKKIESGDYEIGIIIPDDATELLNSKVNKFVSKKLSDAGLSDPSTTVSTVIYKDLDIQILFAPGTKKSFKTSILNSLRQSASKLETQTLLDYFTRELNRNNTQLSNKELIEDFVNFKEINAADTPKEALQLNSVQHNVPAWTIFGIFFIVISLAGSLIKERDDGSYTRIRVMPGSYLTIMAGKITAYLCICMIQCMLMLMAGTYILPHLGLPDLIIGTNYIAIALITVCTGLAATGYGILIGTLFSTHQQSSTFGAVSIVILAALGGIWVPVYVMPQSIRILAEFSPLYWSLSAFHKLFLNAGTVQMILPYALKLVSFFIFTIFTAYLYNNKNR